MRRLGFFFVCEAVLPWLTVSAEVEAARLMDDGVARSTLIAHGLPRPMNFETAREAEAAVRAGGAIPATIAIWYGAPTVGLTDRQLSELANSPEVIKASRRDLGAAIGLKRLAATTVSATMALAHAAGVQVFATGGIGGAHREETFDISSDLTELARTPVLVVCAGAKNILHLPRTLEVLETRTCQCSATGPMCSRQHMLRNRVFRLVPRQSAVEAAAVFGHPQTGGGSAVLAQPCEAAVAVPADEFSKWLAIGEQEARITGVTGAKITPFLLARLAELSGGRTLAANRALVLANARLAAEVAVAMTTD